MMHGVECSYGYAIKCLMKESPFSMLIIALIPSVFISGYSLRVYELPFSTDYDEIRNSLWLVVVTMTTVGYGDLYPESDFGRIMGILVCFWGVFIVSIFVVTLTNKLAFDKNEEKTYDLLYRLKLK